MLWLRKKHMIKVLLSSEWGSECMEYNKKNARKWSIIGERPTFGAALFELAKENKDIIAVVADVTNCK